MTDTGHTPGKDEDDHRGPWTAQEVNLLQWQLQGARKYIEELEAKLKIFQTPHPMTAPAITPDELNEISESLVRQTPMLIKMLREHTVSVMASVGELVCDRLVELSVEYCPPDQEETP